MTSATRDPNASTWSPPWVQTLGVATWVTDAKGRITFANKRAAALLGREGRSCVGKQCHSIVSGVDELGHPLCGTVCAIRQRASHGLDIEPITMRLPGPGEDRWIQVLHISVGHPHEDGPFLVHCVLDQNRLHRIEEYLTRVATRSNRKKDNESQTHFRLTSREKQILTLLVGDETLYGIAAELNLSHATVRNHVQHILAKLGVHSIMEAVAYFLLHEDS